MVIIITGTSSGIGLETAKYLAQKGYRVYGVMRATSLTENFDIAAAAHPDNLFKVTGDISRDVSEVVEDILSKEGRIDVLINNAAYALVGTVESCTLEEQQALFNVAYFGAVRMIQAVLPEMRRAMQGHIINVSSCCGISAFPVLENYSAAKFALEGLSESMASSLSPFGIKVSVVETGSVKTQGGENEKIGTRDLGEHNPYLDFHKNGDAKSKDNLVHGDSAIDVAAFIHEIINSKAPHLRYPFGDYSTGLAVRRWKDPTGDTEVGLTTAFLKEEGLLPNAFYRQRL